MLKVWVLTREINEYNQEGAYFCSVHADKPSIEFLVEDLGVSAEYAKHILNRGGRLHEENEWFILKHLELR